MQSSLLSNRTISIDFFRFFRFSFLVFCSSNRRRLKSPAQIWMHIFMEPINSHYLIEINVLGIAWTNEIYAKLAVISDICCAKVFAVYFFFQNLKCGALLMCTKRNPANNYYHYYGRFKSQIIRRSTLLNGSLRCVLRIPNKTEILFGDCCCCFFHIIIEGSTNFIWLKWVMRESL